MKLDDQIFNFNLEMKHLENEYASEPFVMHIYRKNELAMLYFPDLSKESASRNLRRWIHNCKGLDDELKQKGYNKNRKFYLKREVELIVEYLGEP